MSVDDDDEEYDDLEFCQAPMEETTPNTFMSSVYYKPKMSHLHAGPKHEGLAAGVMLLSDKNVEVA